MLKTKKLLPMLLTITMLASIIPNRIIAKDTSPEQTQRTEQTEKKVQIAGELEGKREKNVKHFLKDDGTFDLAIYPTAVHYQDNGTWKEIDNSLIEETDDGNGAFLGNKNNDFKIKFAKNTESNKTVSVKKDKYELSWNIEGAQNVQSTTSNGAYKKVEGLTEDEQKKTVNKVTSQLIYADIKPNIDLQYDLNGNNVKETFIIKEKVENLSFILNMNIKKLIPELKEDKTILFYDENDKTKAVFMVQAPFMYDDNHVESKEIDLTLTGSKGDYVLTMKPDSQWLSDPERKYPVTLDPTLKTSTDPNDTYDAHVSSNYPNTNYWTSTR